MVTGSPTAGFAFDISHDSTSKGVLGITVTVIENLLFEENLPPNSSGKSFVSFTHAVILYVPGSENENVPLPLFAPPLDVNSTLLCASSPDLFT